MTRPPLKSRIRLLQYPYCEATVTDHTERGFLYQYDEPIPFGRNTSSGGEMFCDLDWSDWEGRVEILEGDYSI